MTFTLRKKLGSDLTLDRESLTIVRKYDVLGKLPYTLGGDAFDYVSSAVMALIQLNYPTYSTSMGTLFWNSIQLHENHYAQHYDISVTYSPVNRQSGTYQITVDQAVGNVHVTAGRRIAGYNGTGNCPDNGGVFFDGKEVTGTEIPVAEDRIIVSYRHPQAYLNRAYIRAIGTLRGYPCSDAFLGYKAGEVRYDGGQFTETDTEATAQYNFAISPNVTNLVVGGCTVAEKSGFDTLSPTWEPTVDGGLPVRKVLGIEVIRTREHKAYIPVFGWGG
jgi:hypothetical protein